MRHNPGESFELGIGSLKFRNAALEFHLQHFLRSNVLLNPEVVSHDIVSRFDWRNGQRPPVQFAAFLLILYLSTPFLTIGDRSPHVAIDVWWSLSGLKDSWIPANCLSGRVPC